MKTKFVSKIIVFVFFQLLFVGNINAEEITKKINEKYTTTANSIVNIENKFGDIDVENWDENSVQIDVLISVDAGSHSKSESIMKRINVEISQSGDNIYAKTDLDGSFNNVEFSINYKVRMPKNLKLNLVNKFGNVFINELSNKFNIKIKYGLLRINKLSDNKSKPYGIVELAYSKGSRIDNCNFIKINLAYSQLSVGEANAIISSTKYSKLAVKTANLMVSASKYDDYKIGSLKALKATASYSDIEIESLKQILKLTTKYTKTEIEDIPANFKKIVIQNSYGTINLGINQSASYKLNAEAQYAKINVPESKKLSRNKENTRVKYWGLVGTSDVTKSSVDIETKYGNVNLQ